MAEFGREETGRKFVFVTLCLPHLVQVDIPVLDIGVWSRLHPLLLLEAPLIDCVGSLLVQSSPQSFIDRRNGMAHLQRDVPVGILGLHVQLLHRATVLQQEWDQLEIVLANHEVHRREPQAAARLIEVKQHLFAGSIVLFVVTHGKAHCLGLLVVDGLDQWRILELVLDGDVGAFHY